MVDLAEKLEGAGQLLFVGVGNVLRSDDGVGVYICRHISEGPRIKTLTVEVSIENYIGKIRSMEPDEIILIDCMELGEKAGFYRLVNLNDVEDMSFNTHNISLGRWKDFFPFPAHILGIQYLNLDFGEQLSLPVQQAADQILSLINP